MSNRAGSYRTNLHGEMTYKSFLPTPLSSNLEINIDEDMLKILIDANKYITKLEVLSNNIPNMDLFIAMYVRKEALLSSQIEGTQATLEDIFNYENKKNIDRNVEEVVNYIQATKYAINRLETLPICNKLLKETHSILMTNVRGQEKSPGEFRRSQNWIGTKDSTIRNARFIPPCPEDMENAMSDLEKYINSDKGYQDNIDPLIKASLIHYQFETIHPFLDGNGRIGRLLITLFLIKENILTTPSLYISYFLKKNNIEYYDRMSEVRKKGNYEQWIKFFLVALSESAKDAIETTKTLSNLHEKNINIINNMGRVKNNALFIFKYIEANPIINISQTSKALNLTFNTVSKIVKKFIDEKILFKVASNKRNRTFIYGDYLDILRTGTL
ncbi:MAG: Fic family protein [Bdellovibrionota bacterium]